MDMQLQDIIDTREEQPPIWVAFPDADTFKVLVRPLGRKQAEFVEEATEPQWDMATLIKRQILNHDRYLELFLGWVVVDWSGLTVDVLRRLVLLKNLKQLLLFKGEIACDDKAKSMLTRFSPAFSIWVNQICLNVERFNAEREEEGEKKP
ncbi:MAG: hypothetical protein PHZ02_07280 [Desulfocapsaceae bacterium]|nr:hypothetical protein [Desulfocapsaceae bacterium]